MEVKSTWDSASLFSEVRSASDSTSISITSPVFSSDNSEVSSASIIGVTSFTSLAGAESIRLLSDCNPSSSLMPPSVAISVSIISSGISSFSGISLVVSTIPDSSSTDVSLVTRIADLSRFIKLLINRLPTGDLPVNKTKSPILPFNMYQDITAINSTYISKETNPPNLSIQIGKDKIMSRERITIMFMYFPGRPSL